jgi:hypothetical protein
MPNRLVPTSDGYERTSRAFLSGVGLIYAVAFTSLAVQIDGLVGSAGIAPIAELLERATDRLGPQRYQRLPTVFWLDSSDITIAGACWAGALFGLLAAADVAPAAMLAACWILYLSLQTTGDVFLSFQWDVLLLEAGFLAIFLAPLHFRAYGRRRRAPRAVLLAVRWLVFRLMLQSGLVKWWSGDPAWRDLTALDFHFETQPLPTWIGWYVHQLPAVVHRGMVVGMYVVEIVLPFFAFGPRPARLVACAGFVVFQLIIMATGNYGFFNLLTLVLCIALLDDGVFPSRHARTTPRVDGEPTLPPASPPSSPLASRLASPPASPQWPRVITTPLVGLIVTLSLLPTARRLGLDVPWPPPLIRLYAALEPFRIANGYGLFTIMTTRRPEILIEGSADGETWHSYEFRWKPGPQGIPPRFVAPHQPRLDWQMWFAALSTYERQPWLQRFLGRLLDGSPAVRGLLGADPFPQAPPSYVRALVADYRFTNPESRRTHDWWWIVGPPAPYARPLARPR